MPASKLRIGYVPEHFSSPLLLLGRSAWGAEHLELVAQPSGTGQMLSSLDAGAADGGQIIDVAVALTESLIAPLAKGRDDYRLVGSYVRSPLNWAVITGTSPHAACYNSISDLRGEPIGISRIGSGSMVMASVMALQQRWLDAHGAVEPVPFKVQNTFERLRRAVNFPAAGEAKQAPSQAAQAKDGHISKEAFEKGAHEYVERHAAAEKRSALGAHVYAQGWQFRAAQTPALQRQFTVLDRSAGDARLLEVTQTVAYSTTWRAPVLYLEAHTSEGSPLSLEQIEASALLVRNSGAPTSLPAGLAASEPGAAEWSRLSIGDQPLSGVPCAMLHPCETAQWLAVLGASEAADAQASSEVRYIEAFMTLCAGAVEMRTSASPPEQGEAQMEKPETAAFMWEWFTTKPFVDSGEVRFIGNVPTPWPSWTIAASRNTVLESAEQRALLDDFLARLATGIADFSRDSDAAQAFVRAELGYEAADVASWFAGVRWAGDARANDTEMEATGTTGQHTHTASVSQATLQTTLDTLQQAGVVARPPGGWEWARFVHGATSDGTARLVE